MLLNFDDFRWGGPLEHGYGYVQNCSINATGGTGGKPSIRTTALGVDGLGNGVYEGFPSLSRTGIKGVRSNFNVADTGTFGLIEVWQGDKFLELRPNGTSLQVWSVNSGVLFTDTSAFSAGTFTKVELKWTVSSLDAGNGLNFDGSVELKVNDITTGSASGLQLGFALPPGFIRDVQWNVVVVNPHGDVDLMYLCDGLGTMNNDFLGSGLNVFTVFAASGNGTFRQLTPSAGTNQGDMVDETTDDGDTTYLSGMTSALKSTFNFQDFSSVGDLDIRGLKHVASGRKTESGYRRFRPLAYRNNVEQFATREYPIGVGYFNWQQHVWETDPHTANAWTIENINATEFGSLIG